MNSGNDVKYSKATVVSTRGRFLSFRFPRGFMDNWSFWREVIVFIVLCEISVGTMKRDALRFFQPKADNPPELNDFLTNVWEHKADFSFVKQAAKQYYNQNKNPKSPKKVVRSFLDTDPNYLLNDDETVNNLEHKRHVHSSENLSSKHRRYRNFAKNPSKKSNRYRRWRNKRTIESAGEPPEAPVIHAESVGEEGEVQVHGDKYPMKKEAIDLTTGLHRAMGKAKVKGKDDNEDFAYVDLESEAVKSGKRDHENKRHESLPMASEVLSGWYQNSKATNDQRNLASYYDNRVQPDELNRPVDNGHSNPDRILQPSPDNAPSWDQNEKTRNNQQLSDSLKYGKQQLISHQGLGQNQFRNLHENGMARFEDDDDYASESTENIDIIEMIPFEKARSFEIDSSNNPSNNPKGNSLYSVDEGHSENMVEFAPRQQEQYSQDSRYYHVTNAPLRVYYPEQHDDGTNQNHQVLTLQANTRYFAEPLVSSTKEANDKVIGEERKAILPLTYDNGKHDKSVERFGNGFIEISQSKTNDLLNEPKNLRSLDNVKIQENAEEKPIVSQEERPQKGYHFIKNMFHPLRMKKENTAQENSFRSRSLKSDSSYEDDSDEFESYPRARRDFSDTLGLNNDEDYSEDNTYLSELTENNTDIKEDPFIKPHDAANFSCLSTTTERPSCAFATANETSSNLTLHAKNDLTNIKQTLDEPKTFSAETLGDKFTKHSIEKKRAEIVDESELLDDKIIRDDVEQNDVEMFGDKIVKHDAEAKKRDEQEVESDEDEDEYFVDNDVRASRDVAKRLEDKIVQNKKKMYESNIHTISNKLKKKRRNQKRMQTGRNKNRSNGASAAQNTKCKSLFHKINKKEDNIAMNSDFSDTAMKCNTPANPLSTSAHEESTSNPNYDFTLPGSETTKCESDDEQERNMKAVDDEIEKLCHLLDGSLASRIVSSVMDQLKNKTCLRKKFMAGLTIRQFAGEDGKFDLYNENSDNDAGDAKRLIEELSQTVNKMVIKEVRRRLCKRLPKDLRKYLKSIIIYDSHSDKSSCVGNPYRPNMHQGNFLFAGEHQDQAQADQFLDVKLLQETLVNLEGLLLKYHNMNDECQKSAAPVKDYIEDHVSVLRKMVACPGNNDCGKESKESKRDTLFQTYLANKHLENVDHDFVPKFDLDNLIKSKIQEENSQSDSKKDHKREAGKLKASDKYKKLEQAVQKLRERRDSERKIGELFGSPSEKKKRSIEKLDDKIEFEKPVVYSIG